MGLTIVIAGLTMGGAYALLAAGVSLTYRGRGFLTLTQAAQLTLGGYGAWQLARFGIGFWPALFIVPILVAAVFYVLEASFIRSFGDGADPLAPTLVSFGIALSLTALVRLTYGVNVLSYPGPALDPVVVLGVPTYRVLVIALMATIGAVIWIGTKPHDLDDGAAAPGAVLGAIAAAAAGVVAVLMAPIMEVNSWTGWQMAVKALAVAIVAGPGSTGRVMVYGLIAGVIEVDSSYFAPDYSGFVVLLVAVVMLLTWSRPDADAVPEPGQFELSRTPARFSVGFVAAVLAVGVFALGLTDDFPYLRFSVADYCIGGLVAGGIALLFRYSGRLSLGHGALFAIGAYVTATCNALVGDAALALAIGTLAATVAGLVAMSAVFRHPAHFAPAITFTLAALLYQAAGTIPGLDDGIVLSPHSSLFGAIDLGDRSATTGVVVAAFMVVLPVLYFLWHPPRDDRKSVLGRQVRALAWSAAIVGLAGGLRMFIAGFGDISLADPVNSALMGLPAVLGSPALLDGPASILAVLLGTAATTLGKDLASMYEMQDGFEIVLGVVLIFVLHGLPAAAEPPRRVTPRDAPLRFHG